MRASKVPTRELSLLGNESIGEKIPISLNYLGKGEGNAQACAMAGFDS
jgi:hypothetical protein